METHTYRKMYSLGAVHSTPLCESKPTFRNPSNQNTLLIPRGEIVLQQLVPFNKQKEGRHTLNLRWPWTLDHAPQIVGALRLLPTGMILTRKQINPTHTILLLKIITTAQNMYYFPTDKCTVPSCKL